MIASMSLLLLLTINWHSHFAFATLEEELDTLASGIPQTTGAWFELHGWKDIPRYNGTLPNGLHYRDFSDECLLWNKTCGGSRSHALQQFFNPQGILWRYKEGYCDIPEYALGRDCQDWLAAPSVSSAMKSWRRQPQCRSSFVEWHSAHPKEGPWTWKWEEIGQNTIGTTSIDWNRYAESSTLGCCDECSVYGGNIDLFYWPVSGVNSDCISEIGTSESPINDNLFTTDDFGFKGFASRPNPWDTDSEGSRAAPLITSSPSLSVPPRLRPRYHRLVEFHPNHSVAFNDSMPTNETVPVSTAVVSGHTFTSPTLYVGFSQLEARDWCGTVDNVISYTILPFQPGELSTIQAPNWQRAVIPVSLTKPFNFADLPCPPRDVMIADQYKPEPGVPYRPVLAPPPKLRSLRPGWSKCFLGNANFEGIDPPMALISVPTSLAVPTRRFRHGDPNDSPQPGHSPLNPEPTVTPPPTRADPQDTENPSSQSQLHKQPVEKPKDAPVGAHTYALSQASDEHLSNKQAATNSHIVVPPQLGDDHLSNKQAATNSHTLVPSQPDDEHLSNKQVATNSHTLVPSQPDDEYLSNEQALDGGQTKGKEPKESDHHDSDFNTSNVSPDQFSATRNAPTPSESFTPYQNSATRNDREPLKQIDPVSTHIEGHSPGKPDKASNYIQETSEGNRNPDSSGLSSTYKNEHRKHSTSSESLKTSSTLPPGFKHHFANDSKTVAVSESEALLHTVHSDAATYSPDQALPGITTSIDSLRGEMVHKSRPRSQPPQQSITPPNTNNIIPLNPPIISTEQLQPNLSSSILASTNANVYSYTPLDASAPVLPISSTSTSTETVILSLSASVGSAGEVVHDPPVITRASLSEPQASSMTPDSEVTMPASAKAIPSDQSTWTLNTPVPKQEATAAGGSRDQTIIASDFAGAGNPRGRIIAVQAQTTSGGSKHVSLSSGYLTTEVKYASSSNTSARGSAGEKTTGVLSYDPASGGPAGANNGWVWTIMMVAASLGSNFLFMHL